MQVYPVERGTYRVLGWAGNLWGVVPVELKGRQVTCGAWYL